ncbi:MAG TPA: alpha/beta hydrolase [Anaerolineae bacterium]|nr:alpha/beta hydrolase [Anaerolineae bacterium]
MKRSSAIYRTARSVRPVMALAVAAVYLARKWPAGKRHLQFVRAFRAGRKFYQVYPHLAKDLAYGDRPWQKLDVYWPPHGERLPVLLFVHGGSWNWGDKSLYSLAGARFTGQGFVTVVINYSHFPEVTFPAFVEDAAAAIAWTVNHIDAYHGDPERLFAGGHSAGGHILSLVALDDRYLAAHGLARAVLRGVVLISAPTDLSALQRHLKANLATEAAAGLQAVMGGPDRLPAADPIRHARPDAPPLLLLHGDRDKLVPIEIARNFAATLKAAGASVMLYEYDRTDHFSIVLDGVHNRPDRPVRLLVDTVEFVQRIGAELSSAVKAPPIS